MAEENKHDQEGIGSPETLEQTLDNTQEFLEKNKGLIQKVLIGIILVLGGYLLMKKMVWEPAETASQEALWNAQYVFEADSFATAAELFSEIKEEYGSTPAGNVANLYLGISLMKQGQFEEAADALKDFDGEGYFMPAIGTGLLGDCYSELGENDQAISQYKKAARIAQSKVYSPYFLKKAGLLLEEEGKNGEAAEIYQEILDKYFYEGIVEFREERKEILKLLARANSAS